MNIKRALLILLIVVAVISSVGAVSAGLFDGLFGQTQDNVVEIENITFQTINETKFVYDGMYYDEWNCYVDENESYVVYITNTSQMNDSQWDDELNYFEESIVNYTMQNVSGVEIFNESFQDDDGTEEIWYGSFAIDADHKTIVEVLSTDLNETVKMASTLKFK